MQCFCVLCDDKNRNLIHLFPFISSYICTVHQQKPLFDRYVTWQGMRLEFTARSVRCFWYVWICKCVFYRLLLIMKWILMDHEVWLKCKIKNVFLLPSDHTQTRFCFYALASNFFLNALSKIQIKKPVKLQIFKKNIYEVIFSGLQKCVT